MDLFMISLVFLYLQVWTSTLTRTHQTAKNLDAPKEEKNALDEMGSKQFDHLTYKQLEERYPEMFRAREEDKLNFRYPGEGGESYVDVCK